MNDLRISERPVLDLHVHVGPELLGRRYSIESLAREAEQCFFGFAAKNHFQPTTAWAARLMHRHEVPIIGSITLNKGVGGINPEAVRAAISGFKSDPELKNREKGRFIVWMPTIHAEAHLTHYDRKDIIADWGCDPAYQAFYPEGTGLSVLDREESGRLSDAAKAVLEVIAGEDLVLATGHLSSDEVDTLVNEAISMGIKRVVVTHPFFQATNMPLEKQVELSRHEGVFLELAYVNLDMDRIPVESYIQLIEQAGSEKIVLTTDLGQLKNETVAEGWKSYFGILKEQGISEDQLVRMAVENPHAVAIEDA
jgi:hypothetical protein